MPVLKGVEVEIADDQRPLVSHLILGLADPQRGRRAFEVLAAFAHVQNGQVQHVPETA